MGDVERPRLEGTVGVRDGRRLGFASFGDPLGQPVVWMHGTPGARRQIPLEARAFAEREGLRILGVDRPGVGSSTRHVYRDLVDWTTDLEILADTLGIDRMHVIGLSGGGAYALAAGAALAHRVDRVVVIGGVAPTTGPDAAAGGAMALAKRLSPLLRAGRVPIGLALTTAVRLARPLGGPALDAYRLVQPAGDRRLLGRPEFRAMFLDDLLNGSRRQITAPLADLLLFTRDWGFRLEDVRVPVLWWHGDEDHIVPVEHGRHCVARLPHARFMLMEGESHLGGLGLVADVLTGLLADAPLVRPLSRDGAG